MVEVILNILNNNTITVLRLTLLLLPLPTTPTTAGAAHHPLRDTARLAAPPVVVVAVGVGVGPPSRLWSACVHYRPRRWREGRRRPLKWARTSDRSAFTSLDLEAACYRVSFISTRAYTPT